MIDSIDIWTAKLEEIFVSDTKMVTDWTGSMHSEHFHNSNPILYSKTDRNVIVQFENGARIYICKKWNIYTYIEKINLPSKFKFILLDIFSDETPKCFKAPFPNTCIIKHKVE
jgi:hypothetical protein